MGDTFSLKSFPRLGNRSETAVRCDALNSLFLLKKILGEGAT